MLTCTAPTSRAWSNALRRGESRTGRAVCGMLPVLYSALGLCRLTESFCARDERFAEVEFDELGLVLEVLAHPGSHCVHSVERLAVICAVFGVRACGVGGVTAVSG